MKLVAPPIVLRAAPLTSKFSDCAKALGILASQRSEGTWGLGLVGRGTCHQSATPARPSSGWARSPRCLGTHSSWGRYSVSGQPAESAPTAHSGCAGHVPGEHSLPPSFGRLSCRLLRDMEADSLVSGLGTACHSGSCARATCGQVSLQVPCPRPRRTVDTAGLPKDKSRSRPLPPPSHLQERPCGRFLPVCEVLTPARRVSQHSRTSQGGKEDIFFLR